MKSIVFSFKKRYLFRRSKGISPSDVRFFIRRYSVVLIFVSAFLTGLVFGSIYASKADKQMLDSLDFLFTTNLDARLGQNAVSTFCACFASDFIFLTVVFLLGLAPWGIPFLPFVSAFKGFGTGLTAAYLIITYSLKGAGFYLLVVLPGTFLFCLALVKLSAYAFEISKQMFFSLIGHSHQTNSLKNEVIDFCSRAVSALIMTFCSTLLDTALWCLFSSLFHNLPRLLLTNVLFALPFAVIFGIFFLINTLTGLNSMFIYFLTIIPLFPFYAGVTQVTSHMVRGEENVDVFSNFIGGIKENLLRFLIHGVVMYAAVFISYYSIVLYLGLGSKNGMFYVPLVICILIAIFFLFMFFYVPPMTVTFDIKMKDIYKNSALMTIGELKHNLFAVFGIFILFLVCATVLMCSFTPVLLIIFTIVLALFIVPSILSFIINSAVYKNMYSMIVDRDSKSKTIDKKMENRRKGQFRDDEEPVAEDYSDLEIDESADGDEFIFYNGKMMKRSYLLKLKKEAEERKNAK